MRERSRASFFIPHSALCIGALLRAQGVVDHFLKSAERLSAGEELPVDEKRRGAAHTNLRAVRRVFADRRDIFPAVETGVKLRGIKLQVRRKLLQIVLRKSGAVGKQLVVVFPVFFFILLKGAAGRFRRFLGVVVNAERKILVHDSDFIFIGLSNFGEFRLNSSAVRSLEVGELNNSHRRRRRSFNRRSVQRDIQHWRL